MSVPMQLVERDGFLAAEAPDEDGPGLTASEVTDLLERTRYPRHDGYPPASSPPSSRVTSRAR